MEMKNDTGCEINTDDVVLSCSWTKVFETERNFVKIQNRSTCDKIEMLVSEMKDNPSPIPITLKKSELSKRLHCEICSEVFPFFGAVKLQCPICLKIVCKKCQNPSNGIQLPPPHVGKLLLCKECKQPFDRVLKIEKFKLSIEEAKNSRFILWYNTLMAIKREIIVKMPPFCGIAMSLSEFDGSIDIIRREQKLDLVEIYYHLAEVNTTQFKMMELNFKNYETRLKKIINTYQPKNKREETVKKNLQIASVQFLEKELPRFNTLSMKLLNFLSSPELKKALKEYENKKEKDKEAEDLKQLEEHRKALGFIERQPHPAQAKLQQQTTMARANSQPVPTNSTASNSTQPNSIVPKISFSTKNIFSDIFGSKNF